jgi:hypothetical protein
MELRSIGHAGRQLYFAKGGENLDAERQLPKIFANRDKHRVIRPKTNSNSAFDWLRM